MKSPAVQGKIFFLFLLSFFAGIPAADFASIVPGAGIRGTAHDLSHNRSDELEICKWCHPPYFPSENSLPLWNQKVTEMTYQFANTRPEGPQEAGLASTTEPLSYQPGLTSMLCLSCHDGTLACNEYGYLPSKTKSSNNDTDFDTRSSPDGANRKSYHPIGFNYRKVEIADIEIRGLSERVNDHFTIEDLLRDGKMECATCHDVHNSRNEGEKFLWKSDARSGFCLTCHVK